MNRAIQRVDHKQLTDDLRPGFRRLTRNVDEADEAIQEAWARWIAKCDPLVDDATIKKQLTVIGRNYFLNRERKRRTERRNQLNLLQLRPLFFAPDQKDKQLTELLYALEKLDPLEREVVEKRQYQPFAEIADSLGLSESSVRRIHSRALARLRRLISDA
jgi:RNA polymerase sigma factor (sigma-70 family)